MEEHRYAMQRISVPAESSEMPVSIRHQNVSQDTIYFNVLLPLLLLLLRLASIVALLLVVVALTNS